MGSSNKTNKSDLKRLLFYLIVKCELLRFNETVASYRRKAREVAQDINRPFIVIANGVTTTGLFTANACLTAALEDSFEC